MLKSERSLQALNQKHEVFAFRSHEVRTELSKRKSVQQGRRMKPVVGLSTMFSTRKERVCCTCQPVAFLKPFDGGDSLRSRDLYGNVL